MERGDTGTRGESMGGERQMKDSVIKQPTLVGTSSNDDVGLCLNCQELM